MASRTILPYQEHGDLNAGTVTVNSIENQELERRYKLGIWRNLYNTDIDRIFQSRRQHTTMTYIATLI